MKRDDETIIGTLFGPMVDQIAINRQRARQEADRRQGERDRARAMRQPRPRSPLTPAQKTLRRALLGAGFLMALLWLSPIMWRAFAGPLWLSLKDPPLEVWLPVALWAFGTLASAVALLVSLKEAPSRVPQNLWGAFLALSLLVGLGVLFLKQVYPADAPFGYAVRGLYITAAAITATYFWIASGLGVVSARRRIRREIARRNAPMRPVRASRNW